jgi:hypothetical protein
MTHRWPTSLALVVALLAAPGGAAAAQETATESAVLAPVPRGEPLGAAAAIFPGSVARTDTTRSRSYVTLVGPGFDIDTVGESTILVQFTSYGHLDDAGRTLFVRAVIDGAAINPGAMRFTGARNTSIAYSGWISGIGPGHHSIRMQWAVSSGTATIGYRTTVVTVIPE